MLQVYMHKFVHRIYDRTLAADRFCIFNFVQYQVVPKLVCVCNCYTEFRNKVQISLHPVDDIRYSSKCESSPVLALFQGWWCFPKSNYFWLLGQVCYVPLLDQTTTFGINSNLPVGERDKMSSHLYVQDEQNCYGGRIICLMLAGLCIIIQFK